MRSLQQILEALQEYYHFTHTHNLIKVLSDDVWLCSEDDYHNEDDFKDLYYVSLTRSKTTKTGYPTNLEQRNMVRVIFDGRKLSQQFKIRSVDYFPGFKNFVPSAAKRDPEAYKKFKGEWMKQGNVEAEDRLYSKQELIKNISKFIVGVDVNIDDTDPDQLKELKSLCEKRNIPFNEYNQKHFELGR